MRPSQSGGTWNKASAVSKHTGCGMVAILIVAGLLFAPIHASAAQPSREAIAAWNAVIERTESEIAARGGSAPAVDRRLVRDGGMYVRQLSTPDGRGGEVTIPGATLQRWRGALLIPGTTVEAVVHSLEQRPPQQPDVSRSRILSRSDNHMAVYLRLVRHLLVTVTYDTEHAVTFTRQGPGHAFSRSVMTRVQEVSAPDTADERPLAP